MTAEVDLAVVGGGVVGLSIAHLAARRGRSVILCERRGRLGEEQSTHNSGVLHAGLYYPPGSLKALLCIEGRREMVTRCAAWGVPHRISGKLVVATEPDEEAALERLYENAAACGVTACRLLEAKEISRFEPHVRGRAALLSPETGVLDAGGYVRALAARAQEAGATLLAPAEVIGLEPAGDAIRVTTRERGAVLARSVVNAAGLGADEVARLAGNDRYRIHPCRGEYASVIPARADLVRGLVYPAPQPAGPSLGVHFTRTVFGELWIGPTVRFLARKDDHESDRLSLAEFHRRVVRLVPDLALGDLREGPTGIRAKRVPEGAPAADFLIERDPALPALVHLVGIESPGLTASPAIAQAVVEQIA